MKARRGSGGHRPPPRWQVTVRECRECPVQRTPSGSFRAHATSASRHARVARASRMNGHTAIAGGRCLAAGIMPPPSSLSIARSSIRSHYQRTSSGYRTCGLSSSIVPQPSVRCRSGHSNICHLCNPSRCRMSRICRLNICRSNNPSRYRTRHICHPSICLRLCNPSRCRTSRIYHSNICPTHNLNRCHTHCTSHPSICHCLCNPNRCRSGRICRLNICRSLHNPNRYRSRLQRPRCNRCWYRLARVRDRSTGRLALARQSPLALHSPAQQPQPTASDRANMR